MNAHTLRQIAHAPAGDSANGGGTGENAGTITKAKDALTSTARDTAARIKSAAGDTANRAKSEAQRFASQTKEQTANRIGNYSSAMRESAKKLEEQDPNIAWATHRLADRVDGVADYIRNSDLAQLKSDVEGFARRHPVAFFGGLFLGGLVVGNLLKASASAASNSDAEDELDFDTGNMSGTENLSGAGYTAPEIPTANLSNDLPGTSDAGGF
jgi:hypothetical protein